MSHRSSSKLFLISPLQDNLHQDSYSLINPFAAVYGPMHMTEQKACACYAYEEFKISTFTERLHHKDQYYQQRKTRSHHFWGHWIHLHLPSWDHATPIRIAFYLLARFYKCNGWVVTTIYQLSFHQMPTSILAYYVTKGARTTHTHSLAIFRIA